MSEQRRVLLAVALCALVWLVYEQVVVRMYPPPPPESATNTAEEQSTTATTPPPSSAPDAAGAAAVVASEAPAPADRGAVVPIETPLYSATLATTGGRLTSFRLKHYRTTIDPSSDPLEMIEVAPSSAPPLGARFIADDGQVEDDTAVVYAADQSALDVAAGASAALHLRGTLPSGAAVEKTLTITGDGYPITVAIRADSLPPKFTRIGIGWRRHVLAGNPKDPETRYRSAVVLQNNKLVHEMPAPTSPQGPKPFEPPVAWAGYADHYFLAALAYDDPAQAAAVVNADADSMQILVSAPRDREGGAGFTLYVGPKDVELLEAANHQLARAVEFGWFAFLSVPLLRLLKLFHHVMPNWGIDIILLTILVKVLFLPLSQKSMKQMRDMQRLQPQMAKLREKFKDDRERLNKEMMELYRRHRVNPLGGCLPMLLQFPVFIGLYQGLNQSIALRHAKFGLWVRDLSAHECYPWPGQPAAIGCNDLSLLGVSIPVLVILMGASMLLQQWLSPSTGMDPAQQRMMMVLMPVMFTVMFVNFPSGLVLYWLVNNVLTIGQQWWTNRANA